MQAVISRSDWFQQARTLSTPEISDALDFFNLPGSALGIRPVAGPAKLFGLAFTIRFAPIDRFAPGTVGDYIEDLEPGTVPVLDNGGRLDCTVWGGILSRLAAQKGLAGTVIHGVCRDTAEADAAGYPLYANGRFMRTGKDRVQVEAYQQPVSLGDVRAARAGSAHPGARHPRGGRAYPRRRPGGHAAHRSAQEVRLPHAAARRELEARRVTRHAHTDKRRLP